jgi:hypothetical protein
MTGKSRRQAIERAKPGLVNTATKPIWLALRIIIARAWTAAHRRVAPRIPKPPAQV